MEISRSPLSGTELQRKFYERAHNDPRLPLKDQESNKKESTGAFRHLQSGYTVQGVAEVGFESDSSYVKLPVAKLGSSIGITYFFESFGGGVTMTFTGQQPILLEGDHRKLFRTPAERLVLTGKFDGDKTLLKNAVDNDGEIRATFQGRAYLLIFKRTSNGAVGIREYFTRGNQRSLLWTMVTHDLDLSAVLPCQIFTIRRGGPKAVTTEKFVFFWNKEHSIPVRMDASWRAVPGQAIG